MTHVARYAVVAALAAAMVIGFADGALASPRAAVDVDSGTPGHLIVEVDPAVFDVELDPGQSDEWLVTVRSEAPTSGAVTFDLISAGALAETPGGAWLSLEECPRPWAGAQGVTSCSDAAAIIPAAPFANISEAVRDLGTLQPGEQRHLRIRVGVPAAAPTTLDGAEAEFALTFRGLGNSATVGTVSPEGTIALTGTDATHPVIVGGALLLAGMMLIVLVRACFREETSS
ncbi:hypothetical protein [Salinibacterium sp. ZJ77]|uniref:hypothetical protein n=1 Tax=Salinibacterium sp. ZJ77 TaxID=2708337 RepID=UPI001423582F|nr:hypothetical protein [Salinibacterium sp. ZJ77]